MALEEKERNGGVEIRKKKTVVSGQACRPGKVYPLAVIDHLMALCNLRLVFYYDKPALLQTPPTKNIIHALEESFSEALTFFPPVTGRLKLDDDGNWELKCNDAGVRTVEACVPGVSVTEWLEGSHPDDVDPDLVLTLWEPMADDTNFWSPFQVQLTEFKDGGFAVGLSCPHMQADPHCAALLVKAWGEIHRRTNIGNPPFFHPHGLRRRKTPNTTTASTEYYQSKLTATQTEEHHAGNGVRFDTVTFRFSDASVRRCISQVSESPWAFADPTAFEALAGLLWSACARATQGTSAHVRELGLVTEFRKAMHAPLPHGFFGNAVHFSRVRAAGEELTGDFGHAVASRAIRDDPCRTEEEFWSVIDWWEEMRDASAADSGRKGKFPPPVQMYGPALSCGNLEGLMGYAAVFEDGRKPLHVSCRVVPPNGEGLVLVLPSPEEGFGRTVTATLPEEVARKVRDDPVVQRFEPTVLFPWRSE